jgi:hypothetical protein
MHSLFYHGLCMSPYLRPSQIRRLPTHNMLPGVEVHTIYYPSGPLSADDLGRKETMQAFITMLGERYGGVKEYVQRICSLTDYDIATIWQNLLVH